MLIDLSLFSSFILLTLLLSTFFIGYRCTYITLSSFFYFAFFLSSLCFIFYRDLCFFYYCSMDQYHSISNYIFFPFLSLIQEYFVSFLYCSFYYTRSSIHYKQYVVPYLLYIELKKINLFLSLLINLICILTK